MSIEVLAQPLLLRGANATAPDLGAGGIEHHDVPAPEVIAVVAPAGGAAVRLQGRCRRTEVAEVAGGASRFIIVVAGDGARPSLEAAPAGVVTLGELLGRAGFVDEVPQGRHRTGHGGKELRGGLVPGAVTPGDIPRGQERGIGTWARRWTGRWGLSLLLAAPLAALLVLDLPARALGSDRGLRHQVLTLGSE